ncbi:hypothetical protein Hanom_Chr11g01021131 [Helianthus anomalus]
MVVEDIQKYNVYLGTCLKTKILYFVETIFMNYPTHPPQNNKYKTKIIQNVNKLFIYINF